MSASSKIIVRDGANNPVPQVYNEVMDTYEVAGGFDNAMTINTLKFPWREEFLGTSVDANKWTVSTGSGHTVAVANSVLSIATGTTINTETSITSKYSFKFPFRVMFIIYLSQRIANQEFYLEIVNGAGDMVGRILLDGTTVTSGKVDAFNGSLSSGVIATTILTTAGYAIHEIEPYADEINYHCRAVDSASTRTNSYTKSRMIPDPMQDYFIRVRAKNLGTAPASSTTMYIDAIAVQDITELTAEITGGRGNINANQSLPMYITGGSSTVTANFGTVGNVQYTDSTTNLGASATFTGTVRDMGTTVNNGRFRTMTMHTAGANVGHLVIEQSADNVTFRETHRIPMPSDSNYRIHEFPILLRYIRVKFINGATAQTAFFLASALVKFDGNFDFDKTLSFVGSSTPLAISATYVGDTLNLGANHSFNKIRVIHFADQAGTLYIEQSRDGSTWRTDFTQAVNANTPMVCEEEIVCQYVRVKFANGAVAQTVFDLNFALVRQ